MVLERGQQVLRSVISLPQDEYTQVMEAMGFPFQAIESLNCSIGQHFWAAMTPSSGNNGAKFRK
jgi:hypothetical protein